MKHYFSKNYIKEKLKEGGFRKHLKNVSWMLGGRITSMFISFIATLYIARHLGPTNYGQLSYALSVVGILGFIAPLGLDSVLYRELVKFPERKNELLGTTLLLKLLAGILVATGTFFITFFSNTDDVSRVLIFILSGTFLFNAFQIINFEFLSRSESKYQSVISVLVTIILNILKILVLILGKGVIYLSLILLLESILYAALYVFIYQKKIENGIGKWTWNSSVAIMLLRDGFPVILVTGFTVIYARIDQIFIRHMIDVQSVGIYDAAVRLVDVWNFIPGAIVGALFPAIVRLQNSSITMYKIRMLKLAALLTIIPLCLSLCTTFFAPLIIKLLYGPSFIESSAILRVYIWSAIGTSLGILVQNSLIAKNERALLVISSLVPMIVNVLLNIYWIPLYGIVGSAYATLFSYSLVPLTGLIPLKKITQAITLP